MCGNHTRSILSDQGNWSRGSAGTVPERQRESSRRGGPQTCGDPPRDQEVNYSVIPPRCLVKSTRNGPATTQEEDELGAHFADEADTLGAIRAVIHKYLEKKDFWFWKEVEVPDSDLDQ